MSYVVIPTGGIEVTRHNAGQCIACGHQHKREFSVTAFDAVDEHGAVIGKCEAYGAYGKLLEDARREKRGVVLDEMETTSWGTKVRIAKDQSIPPGSGNQGRAPQPQPQPQGGDAPSGRSPMAHLPSGRDFQQMSVMMLVDFYREIRRLCPEVTPDTALAEARSLVAQYWMACRDHTVALRRPDKRFLDSWFETVRPVVGGAEQEKEEEESEVVIEGEDGDALAVEIREATTQEALRDAMQKVAAAAIPDLDRAGLMQMAADRMLELRGKED